MTVEPRERRRRSIRLGSYDYGSPGAYFVTVCAYQRQCVFEDQRMREVVEAAWQQIPQHFAQARSDEFVVMPNHVHGVIWITNRVARREVGARHASPLQFTAATPSRSTAGSLAAMVGSFKSGAAKNINRIRQTPGAPVWQRNYYERVIRDERELNQVREYIRLNPLKWALDRENPHRVDDPAYAGEWGWLEGGGTVGAQHAAPLHHVAEAPQ